MLDSEYFYFPSRNSAASVPLPQPSCSWRKGKETKWLLGSGVPSFCGKSFMMQISLQLTGLSLTVVYF